MLKSIARKVDKHWSGAFSLMLLLCANSLLPIRAQKRPAAQLSES